MPASPASDRCHSRRPRRERRASAVRSRGRRPPPPPRPRPLRAPRARSGLDFWAGPSCLAAALVEAVEPLLPRGPLWEPAAGHGALVRSLGAAGRTVIATDIAHSGADADFLHAAPPPGCVAIVTNPPFRILNAFLTRALQLLDDPSTTITAAVILLRLDALGAGSRAHALERAAHVHLCAWRPEWIPNSHTSGRWTFCWVTWLCDHRGPPALHWVRRAATVSGQRALALAEAAP